MPARAFAMDGEQTMHRIHVRPRRPLLPMTLLVACHLLLPTPARAGAFAVPMDNAAAWGRAGAGGSLFPDAASAAFGNPAAMGFFDGALMQASASYADIGIRFRGDAWAFDGSPMTGGDGGRAGFRAAVPSLYYARPLSDRWVLGIGQTVPLGMRSRYDADWKGRDFATATRIRSTGLSLSLAYRVGDAFVLGAGVIAQRTDAKLGQVLDIGGAISRSPLASGTGIHSPPQTFEAAIDVQASGVSAGWFAGLAWKPGERDTWGLSYHARIRNRLAGRYALRGDEMTMQALALTPLLYPGIAIDPGGGPAVSRLDIPASASLDWVHRFGTRAALGTTLAWTGWSSFDALPLGSLGRPVVTIPYRYRDTLFAALGGDLRLDERWLLRAGVAWDQSPTRDETRDPRIPDGDRYFASLGTSFRVTRQLELALAYSHQFVGDGTVRLVNQPLLGGARIDGRTRNRGDVVSVAVTYRFGR